MRPIALSHTQAIGRIDMANHTIQMEKIEYSYNTYGKYRIFQRLTWHTLTPNYLMHVFKTIK